MVDIPRFYTDIFRMISDNFKYTHLRTLIQMPKSLTSIHLFVAALTVVVLSGCVTTGGTRIDNVPMYGQPTIERPEVLKRADEEFIKQASEGIGGREKASVVWWMQGDKFMAEGNLDYAMRRYNQSWLLNPNSFRASWGFGRVLLEQGQLDESLKHLEKATQLVDDQYQKVALLADTATAYSVKANRTVTENSKERAKYFALANQHYEESTKLDPNYPNSWRSWARSLYFEGRFAEAWGKVKTARSLGAPEFPPQFIKALEEKMPQPK
jgi:tetratricopeptide (TPR) repeat protein